MIQLVLSLLSTTSGITPLESLESLTTAEKRAVKSAIGDSRVVFLGELTHGDGSTFQFKTSLIKFLHKELGFDGLVWESGFYDCHEMNKEISGNKPLSQVARMGVFAHWARGAESFPVFEYARESYKTSRPLQMAGFDVQPSGSGSDNQFSESLSWFGSEPELTPEDRAAIASSAKQSRAASSKPDPQAAMQAANLAVYNTSNLMLAAINKNQTKFKKLWGNDYDFRYQSIQNSTVFHRMLQLMKQEQPMSFGYNRREVANAKNISFLLNNQFKGKKIIVWAHNGHIFKGIPGLDSGEKPTPYNIDSMGRIFSEISKVKTYSIGAVTGGGSWSWLGNPPIELNPPTKGSLEEVLADYKHPHAFVNIRDLPVSHKLRQPLPGIIDQQYAQPFVANWSKGFDGLIYIDKMLPRTQIK